LHSLCTANGIDVIAIEFARKYLLTMVALCYGLLFKLILYVSSEQIKDEYWYAKTPHKLLTYKATFKIYVVWAGIEPATQGFSVLCSTD
jgi:hypothetical protein